MAKIVVKHYKAVKPGAAAKTLVTEVVTTNSKTGQFLKRMEKTRISKPCFEVIDMRNKVPGDCSQYKINDRVHWLDDISHSIYQRGLDQYDDVFTVGIYEAIVNGKHTYKAMREAEQRKEQEAKQAAEVRARAAKGGHQAGQKGSDESTQAREDKKPQRYDPEVVPFGYFRKRREERLQYVTSVTLSYEARQFSASTRDISVNGLHLSIKGMESFAPGDIVELEFTALLENSSSKFLSALQYEVMGSEQKEMEVLLRLHLIESSRPEGFSDFIIDLIHKYKKKYKLDVEDDYWSIVSGLYERCYTENLMQIPLLISEVDDSLRMDVIAATDGNQPSLHFFHNQVESYDFSAVSLAHRLDWLAQGKELLVALYRETVDGELKIHSAANLEFEDSTDFGRFIQYALFQPEHVIFKIIPSAEHFRAASRRKIELISERLAEKSDEAAERLKVRLDTIRVSALMVDITAEVGKVVERLMGSPSADLDKQGLHVWIGGEQKALDAVEAHTADTAQGLPSPELIRFGYVERRREDRYLAETAIELMLDKQVIAGRTRDISTHGLSIMLDDAPKIKKGDEVKLALISLQKKRPSLNLMAVPYRVVAMKPAENNLLMLERLSSKDEKKIEDFFAELITKNSGKLAVDINDTLGATLSRAYENIIARNQVTIPFFISKAETGGPYLQWVALPDEPLPVLEFFQMSDDYIDFSWLSDPRVLLPLYQKLIEMAQQQSRSEQRPTPIEMEVYLYKDKDPDSGVMVLYSATEFEFRSDNDREAFLTRARMAEGFRIMKLMATYTLEFNKLELDAAIDQLRDLSRHRASRLHEQIQSLVGYGELIDITAEAAF